MKIFELFVLVSSFAVAAQGIVCWVCENQPSNEACRANGRLEKCQENQFVCQNEVMKGAHGNSYITKRCQESCEYNVQSNERTPASCNSNNPYSTCRCCCNGDLCNEASLDCSAPVHCNMLKVQSGLVECSNGNLLGSRCTVSCGKYMMLSGSPEVECVDSNGDGMGEWSEEPRCEEMRPVICPNVNIQYGRVKCTFYILLNSVCSYQCDPLYKLIGSDKAVCKPSNSQERSGVWSSPAPTCRALKCDRVPSAPLHGSVVCSKENFASSTCTFSCDGEYFLDGQTTSECQLNEQWSSPSPVCTRISCPHRISPSWEVIMSCTDGDYLGSVCSFKCRNQFLQFQGNQSIECVDDNDGDAEAIWNSDTPVCVEKRPIVCMPHGSLLNGHISCTDSFFQGSVCHFTCNSGDENSERYVLQGSNVAVCRLKKGSYFLGEWSFPKPICIPVSEK